MSAVFLAPSLAPTPAAATLSLVMPSNDHTTNSALTPKGEIPPAERLRILCDGPWASSSVLTQERSGIAEGLVFFDYDRPREDFAIPTLQLSEATFRHSFWRQDRLAVWTALKALGVSRNRLDRFANCGSTCTVEYNHEQQRFRLRGNYCHDRWCIPCARARSRFIAANVIDHLNTHQDVRAMTLTLKHRPVPLSAQIDRLYACFKLLKATKLWKDHVRGGAAFLEFVIAKNGSDWHPHLHILAEGKFFAQKLIAALWFQITGDSSIVDIRLPHDLDGVAHYAAKYASKSADVSIYRNPEKLAECISATRGRHLCQCFGTWRGIQLTPKKTDTTGWVMLYSLAKLIYLAEEGNDQAKQIMLILRPQSSDSPAGESSPAG
jgi:hypothetical protein